MKRLSLLSFVAAPLFVACGPSVSEVRLTSAPARAESCELDFLRLRMEEVAPGGKYEVLGHVIVGDTGRRDPLEMSLRDAVRPRACAMGGEGVGILMVGATDGVGLSPGSTSIDYVVVRKAREPSKKAAPTRF